MPEITYPTSLQIMLVDDHIMFTQGLTELLKKIFPNSHVSVFTSTEKALKQLEVNEYTFLLSDLIIPGSDVKGFITLCKKKYTALNIIILSSILDINIVKDYLAIGIDGYLSKAVSAEEMKMAFEKIYLGEKYVSTDISSKLVTSYFEETKTELTKKELEILRLIADGFTVIKTAEKLHISSATVMAHRRNIMSKLDLHSAADLVKYAYENKLV